MTRPPTPPSAFGKWFKAQFGRLPNGARITKQRAKVIQLRGAADDAEALLNAEIALATAFNTALYGWNALPRGRS